MGWCESAVIGSAQAMESSCASLDPEGDSVGRDEGAWGACAVLPFVFEDQVVGSLKFLKCNSLSSHLPFFLRERSNFV